MGMEGMGLKKCATSTDVETDNTVKSLQKAEREVENDAIPKKQKRRREESGKKQIEEDDLEQDTHKQIEPGEDICVKKEIEKLRKSFQEMAETLKNLEEFILGKPKEEESPKELATNDSMGNYCNTLFVRGFDTSLPMKDIESTLCNLFSSCGVLRVFVPIVCKTGAPLGFALIDVKDIEKAKTFRGTYMGAIGPLMVMNTMAGFHSEYMCSPLKYCKRCHPIHRANRIKLKKRAKEKKQMVVINRVR